MDKCEKERLYNRISDEDDMDDSEKRAAYFSEVSEQEDRERWENEQSGFCY